MYKIYFDENARDQRGRCDLGIPGSLRDIESISSKLADGMHVVLYDDQELEVEAVLEFDKSYQRWMASPIWSTLKRVHGK
jgi:hypothetical protein